MKPEQDTEKVNGWTNRVTWCLALWLSNDYDTYQMALAWATTKHGTDLYFEERVRRSWHEFPTEMRIDIGADLSGVNWKEVYDHFKEGR